MDDDGARFPRESVSRRSVLKKMGAGAAIAWSAPVLQSLAAPAHAQTYGCATSCPAEFCNGAPSCGANCLCTQDVEGNCFCAFDRRCGPPNCTTSADCGPGQRCMNVCCSSLNQCMDPCGTAAAIRTADAGAAKRSSEH